MLKWLLHCSNSSKLNRKCLIEQWEKNIWKITFNKSSWNNFHRSKQEKNPSLTESLQNWKQNKTRQHVCMHVSVYLSKEVEVVVIIFYLCVKIGRFKISIWKKPESAEVQNKAKPTGNLQPCFWNAKISHNLISTC